VAVEPEDTLTGRLTGKTIVVTRPAHQAEPLCDLLSANGGTPIRFPVLDIAEPQIPLDAARVNAILVKANLLIFISPNAVDYGMKAIRDAGGLPDTVNVAAIGQGTARKLSEWGHPANVFPNEKFDSEALLAMQALQSVAGKQVVIFRGEGGREHLANTLRQRGAHVEYVECYRRVQPNTDTREIADRLAEESIDAIVVTSNEGLQNLFNMLESVNRRSLLNVQLFVVSARGQELAVSLGFTRPAIIVSKASDQGIVDALLQWVTH